MSTHFNTVVPFYGPGWPHDFMAGCNKSLIRPLHRMSVGYRLSIGPDIVFVFFTDRKIENEIINSSQD